MKKIKSSSGSKKKRRHASEESRSKRSRARSRSSEKEKRLNESKSLRKTRWERKESPDIETPAKAATTSEKKEELPHDPPSRIKDLLGDKEKVIEHLFATVAGTALEELIPDYLKKRSTEDLKQLCLEQIKKISDDFILHIISGKDPSSYEKSKAAEKCGDVGHEKTGDQSGSVKESSSGSGSNIAESRSTNVPSPAASESLSSDVLELFATSKEMDSVISEESPVPLIVEEEVAKDLGVSEGDAELLELEMRARAIRSLLKSRSQTASDTETLEPRPKTSKN